MSLALYPSRVRSSDLLDLNKLNLAFELTGQASRELERVCHRLNLMARCKDISGVVATVTDHAFVDDVFGELSILADNPHVFHSIGNEGLNQRVYTFRNASCAVKDDLGQIWHASPS